MKINKYPDGTSYVSLGEDDCTIASTVFRVNSYEDLWHLNQYVDAQLSEHGMCLPIIIPNLIDAQADRRFSTNESSGLKLVCKFLNSMDCNFIIFHPHNPEVVEALVDNVTILDNTDFIEEVISDHLGATAGELVLMSSDAGGFKPLMKLCKELDWAGDTVSASKSREWVDGETVLTQHLPKFDFEGKDVLIVDDISIYGGTFKGLSEMLKDAGARDVYLAVSHMTIQNLGKDPINNYFKKVFTTNSKFDSYGIPNRDNTGFYRPKNLEILEVF